MYYPVNDWELRFEAGIYTDGTPNGDYYPTSIAARELSKVLDVALGNCLGKHFPHAYTSLGIHDAEAAGKISDNEFTLDYFLRHNNEVYHYEKVSEAEWGLFQFI